MIDDRMKGRDKMLTLPTSVHPFRIENSTIEMGGIDDDGWMDGWKEDIPTSS